MRLVALLLVISRLVLAAGIENAICEKTGPASYHIEFQAPREAGSIEVYASTRADRIDSKRPLRTVRRSPVDVTVPAAAGRVYFHLRPQSGPARVVSIRHIPLEGAINFRDLGGYRTADGHHVRWGLVYRSNQLSGLTAKDYEYIASLGIRLVCDFRTDRERESSPTKWQGSETPEFLLNSIDTDRLAPLGTTPDGSNGTDRMTVLYTNMPVDASPQFAQILHRLAKGDLPSMVHCAMGKDRTGLFSAFLLTALGVPADSVKADFALSNRYVVPDDRVAEMAKDYQVRWNLSRPPDTETLRQATGVHPEWLDAAFKVVTTKYGTFDKYLREMLGVSDSELATLRNRLLEE
jgi:protein-tyrosine phosphatase